MTTSGDPAARRAVSRAVVKRERDARRRPPARPARGSVSVARGPRTDAPAPSPSSTASADRDAPPRRAHHVARRTPRGHREGPGAATRTRRWPRPGRSPRSARRWAAGWRSATRPGQAHVRMHGHNFFVPKTASGHVARVQATLVKGSDEECAEKGPATARWPRWSSTRRGWSSTERASRLTLKIARLRAGGDGARADRVVPACS